MAPPRGSALLVAGYGVDADALTAASQRIGLVGKALLATGGAWRSRLMAPGAGDVRAPGRAALKRYITELVQAETDVAVLVGVGRVVASDAGPALVTGPQYAEFPDDATLPLAWIGSRFQACVADRLLVAIAAHGAPTPPAVAWLAPLATHRPDDVLAVDASGDLALVEALLDGIGGAAVDPLTGTVTMRSIGTYLARTVPAAAIQLAEGTRSFATPPPIEWNPRLTTRARRPLARAPDGAVADGDLAGAVLPGRFRIEERIGLGGFATVYRARQLAVDRDVAVKVMPPGVDAGTDEGRLFVQEIQAVGRLDHEHVVRIHQADVTADGRLFFAMELLRGQDLQQLANAGPVSPARAVELVQQLLAGLGAAHGVGLVHADVKPANAIVVPRDDRDRLVLVDFGMARLRAPGTDAAADSAGGTPAFMAPEQLANHRVDARSDQFAAALVLVHLLTGWRRRSATELVPPLDGIADPVVRDALARALALDPADRFATVADFAAALGGEARAAGSEETTAVRLPFRHLAPYTEADRGRIYGRDRDLETLVDHVLYRRAVIYTAPSGTGKTSLLRAGLVPRVAALGGRPVYHACRSTDQRGTLGAAITAAGGTAARGRLVVIVDQLEAALEANAPDDMIADALALVTAERDADLALVLSVREDFLARLVGRLPQRDDVPIVRLGPLDREGARDAIVAPLAEARLAIAPDLLEVLLADLGRAAVAIGAELGWGPDAGAYPPHLQLACSALHDALGRDEVTVTLAHYRRLGGFDAIVGEHLDRVLDRELDDADAAIAREVFLGLVTAAHTRAQRGEAELLEMVGAAHGAARVRAVLEILRGRGLLVRLRGAGGEPVWELVHDSLVPRVLSWIDRRDLARRRAIELVRYHLRRSTPSAPSLLSRRELRELREHEDALVELEREWAARGGEGWTPAQLVARSRRSVRARVAVVAGAAVVLLGVAGLATFRWLDARAAALREQQLRDRDLGKFTLAFAPYDWDPVALAPKPVSAAALPSLTWRVFRPAPDALDPLEAPLPDEEVIAGGSRLDSAGVRRDVVEARAGAAVLVIDGRGRAGEKCAPSIIPVRRLPGYAQRTKPPELRIAVPTCATSRADTVDVPAGPFLEGGPGEPADAFLLERKEVERRVDLPAFWIDRTEVTNGAFAPFAALEPITGIAAPEYPDTDQLFAAGGSAWPVSNLTWSEARAFCRYLGKDLPTSAQWQKALRGGLELPGGVPNPAPRRNLPWITPVTPLPAVLGTPIAGPARVDSGTGDIGPYGTVDMAGNMQEWTASPARSENPGPLRRTRIVRGGNWGETNHENIVHFMAIDNARSADYRSYAIGMRCAGAAPPQPPPPSDGVVGAR